MPSNHDTTADDLVVRPVNELDLDGIVEIDEKISGQYRPEIWEERVSYYLRRDPDAPQAALLNGKVVGFMLGEVRSGEFGEEQLTGWVEVMGVDPECRGRAVGRQLAVALFDHFRDLGATSVRTLVDEDMAELADFFAALGFQPAPIRPLVLHLD